MSDQQLPTSAPKQTTAWTAPPEPADHPLALEIIAVLTPHPKGLRRWSVMRAIRNNRNMASQDIPQKLEADIERVFRRYCAGPGANECNSGNALFFRPGEKAGEVWAAYPDRVKAWLDPEPTDGGEENPAQTPFHSGASI